MSHPLHSAQDAISNVIDWHERTGGFMKCCLNLEQCEALKGYIEGLNKALDECRQCVEDVAIGVALECPKCKKYKPCNCDKGQNGN